MKRSTWSNQLSSQYRVCSYQKFHVFPFQVKSPAGNFIKAKLIKYNCPKLDLRQMFKVSPLRVFSFCYTFFITKSSRMDLNWLKIRNMLSILLIFFIFQDKRGDNMFFLKRYIIFNQFSSNKNECLHRSFHSRSSFREQKLSKLNLTHLTLRNIK